MPAINSFQHFPPSNKQFFYKKKKSLGAGKTTSFKNDLTLDSPFTS